MLVPTKDALVLALDSQPGRADAIAALGEPAVRWALEIAADSTNPPHRRAAALRVLRFARWEPAIFALTKLAQPLLGEWVVWQGALQALAEYPYVELQPFWRDLLGFPRRVVREQALRGLTLVGQPADMIQIRHATRKDTDATMRALVAAAEVKLRLPIAEREPEASRSGCSATRRSR